MSASVDPTHRNRLARETSPYLLQHQHNPVDWWAWGPEALAEAKKGRMDVEVTSGEELESLVKEIFDSPPDVVERAKKMLAQ